MHQNIMLDKERYIWELLFVKYAFAYFSLMNDMTLQKVSRLDVNTTSIIASASIISSIRFDGEHLLLELTVSVWIHL